MKFCMGEILDKLNSLCKILKLSKSCKLLNRVGLWKKNPEKLIFSKLENFD